MKLLQNLSTDLPEVDKGLFSIYALVKEKSFKGFSIFSSGSHLVPRSGIVLAILVEGHPRNIPV